MKNTIFDKIYSLSQIDTYLKEPAETLLVFDIDYTLVHPLDPAFQLANFIKNKEWIKNVFMDLSAQERDLFANLMVFHASGDALLESNAPSTLEKLKKKGCKTLALTASLAIPLNKECLIKKRLRKLKELGFNFADSFKNSNACTYQSMESNFNGYPHYEEGVLITNGENKKNQKGDLLIKFLQSADWTPKYIIFLDDRITNIEVVHEAVQGHYKDMHFTGLHFLGALKYPSKEVPLEEFKKKINALAKEAKELNLQF